MEDRKTQPDNSGRPLKLDAAASLSPSATTSSFVLSPLPSAAPSRASSVLRQPTTPTNDKIQTQAQEATPVLPASVPKPATGDSDIPTRVFRFFSTATRESLGAVGVGLAATTYFVLGRVGLVLIGAFGGIALFVAWEARNPSVTRAIHGETSADLLARAIEYRKREYNPHGDSLDVFDSTQDELDVAHAFDNFRPQTRQALDSFVDAVVRDYIKWWYQPIVPTDQSFPLACRRVLTTFLVSVSNHLSRKRPADAFLDFLTNSSSIVIVFFSELATAFAEHSTQNQSQQQRDAGSDGNPTVSAADAVYAYLAANPDSNLANLLSQKQQANKFRMVADDLLNFLDRQCYDCDPARLFLREITATSILETTLQTCSKAEWINGWIVHLLEAGEPDFNQAIDEGMQTRADASSSANNAAHSSSNSMNNVSLDFDGNVGNISISKGHRSSFESEKMDRTRRKESIPAHRKQLSRADEEMEEAMEEMKRMNEMIAAERALRDKKEDVDGKRSIEAPQPDSHADQASRKDSGLPSPSLSDQISPKASLNLARDDRARAAGPGTASTPVTPRSSTQESPSQPTFTSSTKSETTAPSTAASSTEGTPAAEPHSQFTNFDQLVPPVKEDEELSDSEKPSANTAPTSPPPLSLHNASITIHDEPMTDKGRIKSRPTWDFLIQIEPSNAHHPGWMIVRKYTDFEKLHEVVRRIATISGAIAFTEQHGVLPSWKVHTRASLRGELERYVKDACWYQVLAESEGMKRFLEKDTNNMPAGSRVSGLQAFEAMGKNMLDVLSNAPKGVAEGGKVMVGGMTGVFGNIGNIGSNIGSNIGLGPKRHASSSSLAVNASLAAASSGSVNGNGTTSPPASVLQDVTAYTNRLSVSTPPRLDSTAGSRRSRDSMDSQRSSSIVSTQPGRIMSMERRMSYQMQSGLMDAGSVADATVRGRTGDAWENSTVAGSNRGSNHNSRASSVGFPKSPSLTSLSGTAGPTGSASSRYPPGVSPTDIMDDITGSGPSPVVSPVRPLSGMNSWPAGGPISAGRRRSSSSLRAPPKRPVATSGTTIAKQFAAMTEAETRVAVELMFAVINEAYTLSSAWNIRRTLLTAAKSFLLRPGNPSLTYIQNMMQSSVLDANATDVGIAAHLQRLRENSMPTETERAAWPTEMTAEEKEKLRIKARRLLIQSGVPAALMGVMGQTATADALGRIFDCLQIEEVARGLIFGLMLQAARIVTH
ncbi:px domain-containing protein [Ophiostoma piceae UAMH 11346]|uniref:Px domain-containing protein n=1 Tax=Ophiostoma piceae (strain UAMH 11346) TaxID=1262450 RepID=S3BV24_OPHP1|nr:px domain-containing protein [Ophiostoma piceae UAMH 11346]